MNAACQSITRRSTALVQRYAPELEKRSRSHLRPTNDSYRVDETYDNIKGKWSYLYRAEVVIFCNTTIEEEIPGKRGKRPAINPSLLARRPTSCYAKVQWKSPGGNDPSGDLLNTKIILAE
jgi:transposase-like protein